MKLSIIEQTTIFYWFMFKQEKHYQYLQYLQLGLQPKYALEKVQKNG